MNYHSAVDEKWSSFLKVEGGKIMTRCLVLPFLLFLESHCAKNIAKSGEGKKCNLLTKKLGQNALNRPRIFFDIFTSSQNVAT